MDIFPLDLLILRLQVKTLIDFTNLYLPNNYKNDDIILHLFDECLKMVECNSHETHNIYPNLNAIPLSDKQQF